MGEIGLDIPRDRNGEFEPKIYWLGVLNEIKNRGVEDIMIVSVDGLTGFGDANHAVFPNTEFSAALFIGSVIERSEGRISGTHRKHSSSGT